MLKLLNSKLWRLCSTSTLRCSIRLRSNPSAVLIKTYEKPNYDDQFQLVNRESNANGSDPFVHPGRPLPELGGSDRVMIRVATFN
ncbi:unnamed protein product [Rhodiola kirilowii]